MESYMDALVFLMIDPAETGVVNIPKGSAGIGSGELASRLHGINGTLKNPALKDVAWEYIKFCNSKKAMRIRVDSYVKSGLGGMMNPLYLKMFGYEKLAKRPILKLWSAIHNSAYKNSVPEPYAPNSITVYAYMTPPITSARKLVKFGEMPENKRKRYAILLKLLDRAANKFNKILATQPKFQF